LLLETPLIMPVNRLVPSGYRKVFSWDDSHTGNDRFIKINFPNQLTKSEVDGFIHRDRFCCIIAGNKVTAIYDPRELYSERVRTIRWFEQNAPHDFDLYGNGWDIPPLNHGLTGKLLQRLWVSVRSFTSLQPFPSYRGKVNRKLDVLRRTRFAICYENVRDMPGYITEKIFDCFFAGCIPVYWGANNVAKYIPSDCYIDRRQFADTAAVYSHLKLIDEATYCGYQQRIADFLESERVLPFGAEYFATTIVTSVLQDLYAHT